MASWRFNNLHVKNIITEEQLTEEQLEQLATDCFKAVGWGYAYGPDIAAEGNAPERAAYPLSLIHI